MGQRAAPSVARLSAIVSSTTATAGSGTCSASCARRSWPIFAVTIALAAPMPEAGSQRRSPSPGEETGCQRPQNQSAGEPRRLEPAWGGRQLVGDQLADRPGHQHPPRPRIPEYRRQRGVRANRDDRDTDLAAQARRGSKQHAASDRIPPRGPPPPPYGATRARASHSPRETFLNGPLRRCPHVVCPNRSWQ
jgi:hypothetical protein